MIDRAEVLLHEHYGQLEYWKARRSMRYNMKIVSNFLKDTLINLFIFISIQICFSFG